MAEQGRRDFDAAAAHWDAEPRRVKLALDVAEAIRRFVPVTREMDALDYGCGSGLVTLALQPQVGRITGADSSKGMLEVLQSKLAERGIGNAETFLLDLERQKLDRSYDLIFSSMTMHHVDDVAALIGTLASSLNPGGWLAIADLQAEDGSFHDDPTGVLHHGFTPGFLRSAFESAGLKEVHVEVAANMEKIDKESGRPRSYPVLLAVGRKLP